MSILNVNKLGPVGGSSTITVAAGVVSYTGKINCPEFDNNPSFTGNVDIAGNLDVDGLTNLDDVNVSAAATFAGAIDANGDLDVDGHTELDNVNISGVATATAFIPSQGQLGHRNLIINGAMNVAQRGTSETDASGIQGYTTVDRWKIAWAGANNIIEAHQHTLTSSDTGPYELGFRNAYKLINGAQSSADAADEMHISYRLEAQDIANSGWNYISSSSYITLSFWVKSSVAQEFHGFLLTTDGTAQLYSFSLGSLSANTWTKVTKTIPGNSNLQFDDNNAEGLLIRIALFRGTSKTGTITQNQWAAFNSNIRYPNYTSTWWTTNDAEFELTGVQFEVGSVSTPFEHRSYADELQRCRRYYQVLVDAAGSGSQKSFAIACAYSGSSMHSTHLLSPEMRTIPTLDYTTGSNYYTAYYNGTSDAYDAISLVGNSHTNAVDLMTSSGLTVTQGNAVLCRTSNTASKIAFTAEL